MSATAPVVAFDLGGVLVGVDKSRVARTLDLPWEWVERAFFDGDAHDLLARGALPAREYLARAAAALQRPISDVEAAWAALVSVSAGASELVTRVRCDVCAWSNTDDVHFAALRGTLPARLWERRALSQEVKAAKPEAAFFEAALARAGCTGERVVFLDDLEANVAAARAFGIDAEQVRGLAEATAALARRDLLLPGAS